MYFVLYLLIFGICFRFSATAVLLRKFRRLAKQCLILLFYRNSYRLIFRIFDEISWFDNFMHIMSGLVCAVFGYDFACIIQRKKGQCAATLAALFQ